MWKLQKVNSTKALIGRKVDKEEVTEEGGNNEKTTDIMACLIR